MRRNLTDLAAKILKKNIQILRNGPWGLAWLFYNLFLYPWLRFPGDRLRDIQRRRLRWIQHHSDLDHRLERLRLSLPSRLRADAGVELETLCPELEAIVAPSRTTNDTVALAQIDQDGFLIPLTGPLWAAPTIDAYRSLPRRKFALTVVDVGGRVGVRKDFKGDRGCFLSEVEAALRLAEAGCSVPAVLAVDTERLTVTFEYVPGTVLREALAAAGARLRDRDVRGRSASAEARLAEARRVLPIVVEAPVCRRIADELIAIHRAGFVVVDVKYGNIILQEGTNKPYFVDFEGSLPIGGVSQSLSRQLRDRDSEKLNRMLGTDLVTARALRRPAALPGVGRERGQASSRAKGSVYAPVHVGPGIWWGPIWNTDVGIGRWRFIMADNLPLPMGGSVLDLGTNNGFNVLEMMRAGVAKAIAVDIDPEALRQGEFLRRVYEWSDNRAYDVTYLQASHQQLRSLGFGRFDLVTAFCTLYYLSADAMADAVGYISEITDTFVMQCNTDQLIDRTDENTYIKASTDFTVELMRSNGFPFVEVIAPRGYSRPLVIGHRLRPCA